MGFYFYAVSIPKAAILGIALGALIILLMILAAAFRPHKPAPFFDGSMEKPGYSPPVYSNFNFCFCVLSVLVYSINRIWCGGCGNVLC